MKKKYYLISIVLFLSCMHTGKGVEKRYIVKNKSGVPVKLKGYSDGGKLNLNVILENHEEYARTKNSYGREAKLSFLFLFGSQDMINGKYADSVKFIFNNKKIQTFIMGKLDKNNRNPLAKPFNDPDLNEETYIITKQDYLNAEKM